MFGALSGIVHVDGRGKRLGKYLLPAGDTISEPVFVARGDDAAEGDGWLLSAVWRARENRSDLAVFNAGDVEAGPVALASRPPRARRFPRQLGGCELRHSLQDCPVRICVPGIIA
jgi:carotenoid cleavage dioxygenase-like enzyme